MTKQVLFEFRETLFQDGAYSYRFKGTYKQFLTEKECMVSGEGLDNIDWECVARWGWVYPKNKGFKNENPNKSLPYKYTYSRSIVPCFKNKNPND